MTGRLPKPTVTERATGTLHVYDNVRFRHLPRERGIVVWLPRGYDRARTSYPVLYMHDGQNLFDRRTAFLGQSWGVDDIAVGLIERRAVEPLVVVGIYNTGEHRVDEYTPTVEHRYRRGGKSREYGWMLVEELSIALHTSYRLRSGPAWTGIAGSSLGGLAALTIGLAHPGFFGRLGVMSPSVWWDNRHAIDLVRQLPTRTNQRVWVDVGTREAKGLTVLTRSLRDELVAKGWREGRDLRYVEAANARHNERAWSRRFGPMLEFLFPRRGQRRA